MGKKVDSFKVMVVIALFVLSAMSIYMLFTKVTLRDIPVPVQPPPPDTNVPPPVINNTIPDDDGNVISNPLNMGPKFFLSYSDYVNTYIRPSGAAISNHQSVSWCPNACIGCGEDVSSEAVGRSLFLSAAVQDKPVVDRYTNYYYTVMKHPGTGHMMWKIDGYGQPGSCGGQNSAVDGELEAIEGLKVAQEKWQADSENRPYATTRLMIANALKSGVISTPYGQTLPHCMYPTSNDPLTAKALPCGDTGGKPLVFTGYLNLRALKIMCDDDSQWCPVYTGSKNIVKLSFRNGGIASSYEVATDNFGQRESYIHGLWVLKHAMESGDQELINVAKPYYDQSRAAFYENQQICQQFDFGTGCKRTNARTGAYAEYIEMASAIGDKQFANDLVAYTMSKCTTDGYLCNPDNYGNVAVFQAWADALRSGVTVG